MCPSTISRSRVCLKIMCSDRVQLPVWGLYICGFLLHMSGCKVRTAIFQLPWSLAFSISIYCAVDCRSQNLTPPRLTSICLHVSVSPPDPRLWARRQATFQERVEDTTHIRLCVGSQAWPRPIFARRESGGWKGPALGWCSTEFPTWLWKICADNTQWMIVGKQWQQHKKKVHLVNTNLTLTQWRS